MSVFRHTKDKRLFYTKHKDVRGRLYCSYCKIEVFEHTTDLKTKASADHVIPRSKGGSNYHTNLVVSCIPCNNNKADKILESNLNELV